MSYNEYAAFMEEKMNQDLENFRDFLDSDIGKSIMNL